MRFGSITTVAEMQAERHRMSSTVGLVPTMGFLHEGHLSLVRRALADCNNVVVSIFVNPTQFGPKEDLARYPRDLDRDLRLLESAHSTLGTHHSALVFAPSEDEMYASGFNDWVEVTGPLTERLEGAHRPGHFRGVTTVVARLFRIVRPHRAYFGQKDAQQLRVIRHMVEEQQMPVEIVPMPTVREPDGLALSSRNVYLSPEERRAALALPRALALARRLVMDEGICDAETVRQAVRDCVETPRSRVSPRAIGEELRVETPRRRVSCPRREGEQAPLAARPEVSKERARSPRFVLDYISVSDERTLEELDTIDRPALVLLAARIGTTRLIDNTIVLPKGMPIPEDLAELLNADTAGLPLSPDH